MTIQRVPRHLLHSLLFLLLIFMLSGCLSPIVLNRAVVVYDEAVTTAMSEQLLINIARAQHHQPLHFTRVSNIAATFDFRFSAGATPALTGDAGSALVPIFGGSVAENPTISIVPIQGEEFTKRLLTPFHHSKLALLLRQHFDIDLMLRLMAQEVRLQPQKKQIMHQRMHNRNKTDHHTRHQRRRLQNHGTPITYRNNPSDQAGYEMFRRIALHLTAIQDQNELYAERLTFKRTWTIPADSESTSDFQSLEKEFEISHNLEDNTYTLSKYVLGPILVTNYSPHILCCEEREKLYEETKTWHENDVAFDIHPDYPGGAWPMKGAFRLRSFHAIIHFLSHALGETPEYHVDKDKRTPPFIRDENPINTMDLIVSDKSPENDLSVYSHGQFYAVNTMGPNAHWNNNTFQLLSILFRMTITDPPLVGVPSITIAK